MQIINKLDPRIKILTVLLIAVQVFLVNNIIISVTLMLTLFFLRLSVKIPFREITGLKKLSMLVLFLILIQTLFGPGDKFMVKPLFPPDFPLLGGRGSLKWDGLILGFTVSCRLVSLILILPLLVKTTSPYQITAGLSAFGINYRFAFIITMAFNLVPGFRDEGRAIIDAQKLRGINTFEKGSFVKKLKAFPGLVVPLVLGAMRKAQAASVAMDSRAFGIYKTRTWLEKPVMQKNDYFFLTGIVVFFTLFLLLNKFVPIP